MQPIEQKNEKSCFPPEANINSLAAKTGEYNPLAATATKNEETALLNSKNCTTSAAIDVSTAASSSLSSFQTCSSYTSSSSSSAFSNAYFCGGCHAPLHLPPATNATMTDAGMAIVITCANYAQSPATNNSAKKRNKTESNLPQHHVMIKPVNNDKNPSATLNPQLESSSLSCLYPKFHLSCANIPSQSRLYQYHLKHNSEAAHLQSHSRLSPRRNSAASTRSAEDPYSSSSKIISSLFLCPTCDIQGSSRYLLEYFEDYRKRKIDFFDGDEECIDVVDVTAMVCKGKCRATDRNESGLGSQGFVDYLTKQTRLETMQKEEMNLTSCEHNGLLLATNRRDQTIKASEVRLGHIEQVLSGISHGTFRIGTSCGTLAKGKRLNKGRVLSSSRHDQKDGSLGLLALPTTPKALDPTYLLGQPIRLYCKVDNSYHVARIIDLRTNDYTQCGRSVYTPSLNVNDDTAACETLLLDKDIGRTQYLVRFRAGMDGRKAAVHQWIFLEEHPLMVGMSLVWVNIGGAIGKNSSVSDSNYQIKCSAENAHLPSLSNSADDDANKKTTTKPLRRPKGERQLWYRPAQVFVRTALEMVPVREINPRPGHDADSKHSHLSAMAIFFGHEFHQAVLRLPIPTSAISLSFDATPAIDFSHPPQEVSNLLHRVQCHDKALAVATTMACMEKEEQRRLRTWHGLPDFPIYP